MNPIPLILGLCVAAFGVLLIAASRRMLAEARAMVRRGCGEARAGDKCQVQGRALAEAPILGPVSGAQCVCFHLSIQQEQGSGEDRTLREIGTLDESAPWWLEDDTGKLEVGSDGAELRAKGLQQWYGAPLAAREIDQRLEPFLSLAGIDDLHEQYLLVETCVPLGSEVLARGQVGDVMGGPRLAGGRDLILTVAPTGDGLGRERAFGFVGVALVIVGLAISAAGFLLHDAADESSQGAPTERTLPSYRPKH